MGGDGSPGVSPSAGHGPTVETVQSDVTKCDLCGTEWHEGDPPGDWLALEVTRSDGAGDVNWVNADFCSQGHAAEWLTLPLPPVVPLQLLPRTLRDRLTDVLVLMLFLWAAALMVLGSYALVRLLGGWD